MKSKKDLPILIFVVGMLLYITACGKDSAGEPKPVDKENPAVEEPVLPYIFQENTHGYRCFRIPAVVKSNSNTLLAFSEGRKGNCNDEGDIDLVMRRSTDGGKTWSDLMMIWNDGGNTCGNPAPVIDREIGRIHLLMTWNHADDRIGTINDGTSTDTRRVFYTYSDDDGLSWEEPNEITASVKEPEWGWYATGPGHGLQLTRGDYKGRLVIPCDYIEVGSGRRGFSHAIYSDDNGLTWTIGGVSDPDSRNPNECTVAELSDGRLLLNMRNNGGTRLVAESSDGGESWGPLRPSYSLIDPTCQASLLDHEVDGAHVLFFSNAASVRRENMTIKMSVNDGQTWDKKITIHPGPSAYSDLVMISENELGILYEGGDKWTYAGIAFETVEINDFK